MRRTRGHSSGERGNALLMVFFVAMVMAGMLLYLADMGTMSARTASLQEDRSQAAATAEFAASLAIANLPSMIFTADGTSVVTDWVGQNDFSAAVPGERRISGTLGDYEYVVNVRSLREYRPHASSEWLAGIELSPYQFGTDPVSRFSGVYEITAVARNVNQPATGGRRGQPWMVPQAVVQTVVQVDGPSNSATSPTLGVLALKEPDGLFASENIEVSGEDHYGLRTAVTMTTVVKEIEEVEKIAAEDSQLFSVTGTEWSAGRLSAHYMRGDTPNPNIPRTTAFSYSAVANRPNNGDHRMIALDPLREPDLYVFGGKVSSTNYSKDLNGTGFNLNYEYGRSVTLDDGGYIIENTQTDAEPGGDDHAVTALAVGKAEDLLRIYLNYSNDNKSPSPTSRPAFNAGEITGSVSTSVANSIANWRGKWTQAPIMYHTKNAMKNYVNRNEMPLDNVNSTAKRRSAAKIWIKNAKGEFLVRDYTSYPNVSRALPDEKWNGYYVWAPYGGYIVSETAGASGTTGGKAYTIVGGKIHIGWPEMRYYSVNATTRTNYQRGMHTRFLTLEELTGYQVTKASDGIPAKLANPDNPASAILGGVPDFRKDPVTGEKMPYRINVGGVETQFDEATQRSYNASVNDNYATSPTTFGKDETPPPLDGIYVHEKNDDGTYVMDPMTGQKKVTVYRTMDDFAFDRNIAIAGQPEDVRKIVVFHMVLENTLTPASETVNTSGNRIYFDMGMTVTLVAPKIEKTENKESIKNDWDYQWWEGDPESSLTGKTSHYALSYNIPEEIANITDPAEKLRQIYILMGLGDPPDMSKVKNVFTMFDSDGNPTTFPRATFNLKKGTADYGKLVDPVPGTDYYYNKDEVYFFVDMIGLSADELDGKTDDELEALAVQKMRELNPGYTFLHVKTRFAIAGVEKVGLADIGNPTDPSAAIVPSKYITGRTAASELFGYQTRSLPGAYMLANGTDRVINRDFYGTTATNAGVAVDPIDVKLGFLAGEHNQDAGVADTVQNTPEPPGPDHIPFPAYAGKTQADGSNLEPKFIWDDNYQTVIRAVPVINGITHAAVLQRFSSRDTRGGLGWHRAGPDADPTSMEQDHYEYVVLGKRGFQPYQEVAGGGKTYVSYVSMNESYDRSDSMQILARDQNFKPEFKSTSQMPTFVISGAPLDGAGVMVVNGNLRIETSFAYNGILIVLGDLTVVPTLQTVVKRNADGQVVNPDGVALSWDSEKGSYYFINADGNKVDSLPATESTYVGKLTVQGRVMVDGKVSVTPGDASVTPPIPGGLPVIGSIDIRGSQDAINAVTEGFVDETGNFKFNQLNWMGGENANVQNLW